MIIFSKNARKQARIAVKEQISLNFSAQELDFYVKNLTILNIRGKKDNSFIWKTFFDRITSKKDDIACNKI